MVIFNLFHITKPPKTAIAVHNNFLLQSRQLLEKNIEEVFEPDLALFFQAGFTRKVIIFCY